MTTKKGADTGGNKAVRDNLTKRGVPADKARETARKFRENANKKKRS